MWLIALAIAFLLSDTALRIEKAPTQNLAVQILGPAKTCSSAAMAE